MAERLRDGLQTRLDWFDSSCVLQICVYGEMVNALASKPSPERVEGSSPSRHTKYGQVV